MKNKIIIALALVLGLLAAGLYAYREYNRAPIDTATSSPDFSVKGTELIAAFEQDEPGATARYVNKLIRIEDSLLEIKVDYAASTGEVEGYTFVVGAASATTTIRCSMDSLFSISNHPLAQGDKVVLQGICSGYNKDELLGSDIVLVRCALVKE
ncbi:MAG: hypothetical protein FJ340_08055 [Sphingomonadales bacterium]|nr:hypothetical protein [Sphingomonadales bacterium]